MVLGTSELTVSIMVSVTSELTVSIMILVTSEHRGVVKQLKPADVTSCGSGPNVVTVGWLPDRVSLCFMSVPLF